MDVEGHERPKSAFQQKLDADPALRERIEQIAQQIRRELPKEPPYDFCTEDMRHLRAAYF